MAVGVTGVKAIRVKSFPTSAGAAQLLHQANRLRIEIRIFGKMLKKLHQLSLRFKNCTNCI